MKFGQRLPYVVSRNELIIKKFRELQDKGMRMIDIELLLADEFYLSENSVHAIRYNKKSYPAEHRIRESIAV